MLTRLEDVRGDPTYPELVERLTGRARALLGQSARTVEVPEGGVVAETDGRRVELTFPVLADQAVAALGAELEGLWKP